ncbi:MAG: DUF3494 domain-containing protein [Actinobacteria bacterium]|nr:DUF3494 domain-containing protein [Actinomycetota bacterium]
MTGILRPVLTFIVLVLFMAVSAEANHVPTVGLGTADSFAILAGSGVTNTGESVISGDVGSHPTTSVGGFPPGIVQNGTINPSYTESAKASLVTAYNDAAGRTPVSTIDTELGGQTLVHGVYDSAAGTFEITGTLVLDAQGDPNAVWIFKMASSLTTASSSNVSLINGASECNVFWQIGSSATLGTSSTLRGTMMALTSITLTTDANVFGRALARNGAVTLDSNNIDATACSTAPAADVTPTPSPPGDSTTPTPTATVTNPPPVTTATTGTPATTSTTAPPANTTTTGTPVDTAAGPPTDTTTLTELPRTGGPIQTGPALALALSLILVGLFFNHLGRSLASNR